MRWREEGGEGDLGDDVVARRGYSNEFLAALREAVVEGDSMDLMTVVIARREGFDPDELWKAVGEVTGMVDDDDVFAAFRQKIQLAEEIRKKARR